MPSITINIKDCSECKFHHTTPCYTPDSFERPDDWWCKAIEDKSTQTKLKKVAGYVDWYDKVEIPEWCPLVGPDYKKEKQLEQLREEQKKLSAKVTELQKLGGIPGPELTEKLKENAQALIELTDCSISGHISCICEK